MARNRLVQAGSAPVAQWIEQRFPKPRAHVRFMPGAFPLLEPGSPRTSRKSAELRIERSGSVEGPFGGVPDTAHGVSVGSPSDLRGLSRVAGRRAATAWSLSRRNGRAARFP